MMSRLLPCLPILALCLFLPSLRADDDAWQLITQGGGEVDLGKSVPGALDLTEDSSFPVLSDSRGAIIGAAGTSKAGRAVAFSHDGFLKSRELNDQEGVFQLIQNALRWAGRSGTPEIGVHPALSALAEKLKQAGMKVTVFDLENLKKHNPSVYCAVAQKGFPESETMRLFEFLNDGGGVVLAATPWPFHKDFPDFSEFPANQILFGAGIQFLPTGYADRTLPLVIGKGREPEALPQIAAMPEAARRTSSKAAAAAMELAARHETLSAAEKAALIAEMKKGIDLKKAELEMFLAELKKLNLAIGPIVPTGENPVISGNDPLVDAVIELEDELNQKLPGGTMYALPAAADYPGAVPEAAERVSKNLKIDGRYRGWLSGRGAGGWAAKEMRTTGIYAPPGEPIVVTAPGRILGEGFEVTIGAYGGRLKNDDKWTRYPRLVRHFPIVERRTVASNGFGGLVTIRIPKGADYEDLDFAIEGGVRAPLYLHGETSLEEWKSEIRNHPAPWAELASKRMIIAIPSDHIRGLADPDAVMEVWNGIIDTSAVLAGVDRDHYRAERIVFDRQTSAGWMHSGYPVAAHLGQSSEQAVDARALREEGNWGFFHEYGHNHQHDLWSLPGTGETTCNLWSVFVFEEFIGKKRDATHGEIAPLNRVQKRNAYFQSGRNFESDWNVWAALDTYLLVQEEFGWAPFTRVFDEYNRLPPDQWPKTQEEKNDQWVIRLSRACGKNLATYWAAWNLPLSDRVFAELKDLPDWENHPVAKYAK